MGRVNTPNSRKVFSPIPRLFTPATSHTTLSVKSLFTCSTDRPHSIQMRTVNIGERLHRDFCIFLFIYLLPAWHSQVTILQIPLDHRTTPRTDAVLSLNRQHHV